MLSTLFGPVRGALALMFLTVSTFWWGWAIFPLGLLKLVIPIPPWRRLMTWLVLGLANAWVATNRTYFRLANRLSVEVYGREGLARQGRYLVLCNHQTWADIFILCDTFSGKIPLTRYFMKQELIWLPVVGFTCWALDMPIVKRYSREQRDQRPELAGKDLEATRRSSLKYRRGAVTIVNFVEGTRFTTEKHARQESPFKHLLKPRAGGVGFVLEVMGDILTEILDVTIIYPDDQTGFWDFLCGRVKRVIVVVERIALTDQLTGHYSTDEDYRQSFQAWLNALWAEKDAKIGRLRP
jgi:1-acyl-sn-glycerol-3-phosphate acyltransferase